MTAGRPTMTIANPDDEQSDLPAGNKDLAQVRAFIAGTLLADEVRVLAAFYFDGQRQTEIAAAMNKSQSWVSKQLGRARRKLAAFGVVIPEPTETWTTPGVPKVARCEPAALDQLLIDDSRDGPVRGRWLKRRPA